MDINKNIHHILKSKKVSQKELANNINVSASTLNNWLKLNRSIPSEYIIPICEFLKVSPMFLLLNKESSPTELTVDEQELLTYFNELDDKNKGKVIGKAETLAELNTKTVKSEPKNIIKTVIKHPKTVTFTELDQATKNTYTYIDLYDMPASAGTGVYLTGNACEPLKVQCNSLTTEANFAVEVRGGSMEPKFYDGDIVLIKTQPCIEVGEIGIFIINEEGYIKQFGGDKLISINSKYNDVILHDYDSCYCKGKVIGVLENDDILE